MAPLNPSGPQPGLIAKDYFASVSNRLSAGFGGRKTAAEGDRAALVADMVYLAWLRPVGPATG